MIDTHAKGVRMQLLCLQEFLKHLEGTTVKIDAIWNAPNLRPSKTPDFIPEGTIYSNKDLYGDWDIGIWCTNFIRKKEYRIQVKSEFRLAYYEDLVKRWSESQSLNYLAVYEKGIKREADLILPHFKLFKV